MAASIRRAVTGTVGGGALYAAFTQCNGFTCRLNQMPVVPVLFCAAFGLTIALSSRYEA